MPRVSSDVASPNCKVEILVLVLVAIWAAGFIAVVIDLYRGYHDRGRLFQAERSLTTPELLDCPAGLACRCPPSDG